VLRGDSEFGVVLIERGSEVGGGDTRFDVGTVARVVGARELPDGGFALGTVGVRRIRVATWLADDPFPQAEVTDLPEPVDASAVDARVRDRAVEALREVCALYRLTDPRIPDLAVISNDAVQASYELAASSPIGPLDAQRVLETAGAGDRLVLLAALLDEHARMLRAP
jgi:Lon protease-like protein